MLNLQKHMIQNFLINFSIGISTIIHVSLTIAIAEIKHSISKFLTCDNPFYNSDYALTDDQLENTIDLNVNCMNVYFTIDYKIKLNVLFIL